MKKSLLLVIATLVLSGYSWSKEGMWLPVLLQKYNLEEMQQMGFRLSAADIYDVNHASMKDAVVLFGGGCTGELISDQGLLITNHHCGYRAIQSHSSVENDYLTNGFWASNKEEELPNPGLSVSFLERMEEVTDRVLEGTGQLTNPDEVEKLIHQNSVAIEKEAVENGRFRAQVKPLFYGNQYFLYVYKVYTDVRLVGAPPSAIGKFGGDTDNWMWPRHTGDFSFFRIYAGKDNEPASYSPDNVPFKPKKFFPISLKGANPGDFTMVFGYPGRTTQYLTSYAVDLVLNQRDPDRIAIRDKKLAVIGHFMEQDPRVRIQYAAKYAGISNSWKRWQGEILGLKRLGAVERKQQFEREFEQWARAHESWDSQYAPLFGNFKNWHEQYAGLARASDYYSEIVFGGVEIFTLGSYLNSFLRKVEKEGTITDQERIALSRLIDIFYKDYYQPADRQLAKSLLPTLAAGIDASYLPIGFPALLKKFEDEKQVELLFRKSVLADSSRLKKMAASASPAQLKKILKDPVMLLSVSLRNFYETRIGPPLLQLEANIEAGMKTYMLGIMQMKEGQPFYPDANSTLRVAYGKVEGYEPRDGVVYKHLTTLEGIMEKDNPEIYDYDVPARLKELYQTADYGRYAENGEMPVCFTASNHTTGGNSGSPVVNAAGELIGLNFDRCWEGTMSDIMYDPDRCRNIILDIRYALFITDKFAGAGYLLDEMEIRE